MSGTKGGIGNGWRDKMGLVITMLMLAFSASATNISSDINSDYAGGGYACRITAFVVSQSHRSLEFKCTTPTQEQTTGKATVLGCPNEWVQVPLVVWGSGGITSAEKQYSGYFSKDGNFVEVSWTGGALKEATQWVRVTSYINLNVSVRVGTFGEVITGGGLAMTWNKVQPVTGGNTYFCGSSRKPK